MSDQRFVLVVELWLHAGQEAAFEALERELARHMARHDGRIELAVRLDPAPGADLPFEVHVVSFRDRAAFETYRADPEVRALIPRREHVIARTELRPGRAVAY